MIGVLARIAAAAAGALAGAAVAKELDKPDQERDWHGEIAGVPYDFRAPDLDKFRRAAWDPDNPSVVGPPAFGVGWSINLAQIAAMVQPPTVTPAPVGPRELPAAARPELPAAGTPALPAAASSESPAAGRPESSSAPSHPEPPEGPPPLS
ncbi:hypothetical protein [Actinoplanes sp. NPDC049265]|uniref:hypothetical protein n=1 Tax=Actinoplanes sp. NPDC049265 TaxID=3363902 RepID=UPI0037228F2D